MATRLDAGVRLQIGASLGPMPGELAGFRANEVADMFGVRKETVSRWERGEVEIPRTAAYALGELFAHPKLTRQRLEAFAQP